MTPFAPGGEDPTGQSHPPHDLAAHIPPGIFVGTSLILWRNGRFLYGIRRPKVEGSRSILELTGIGGALEPEDASLGAGALREVSEEIGCPVQLLPSQETLIVRGPGAVEWVALDGEERPVAVVFRRYRTPPHQPWHERNQGEACLVVFLAELQGEPQPVGELPALIWLSPRSVIRAAQRDVPLSELLRLGATLVEREPGSLPRDAWARLTDSQEALVLALDEHAVDFYSTGTQYSITSSK